MRELLKSELQNLMMYLISMSTSDHSSKQIQESQIGPKAGTPLDSSP
jgi:hypothetical protein